MKLLNKNSKLKYKTEKFTLSHTAENKKQNHNDAKDGKPHTNQR